MLIYNHNHVFQLEYIRISNTINWILYIRYRREKHMDLITSMATVCTPLHFLSFENHVSDSIGNNPAIIIVFYRLFFFNLFQVTIHT